MKIVRALPVIIVLAVIVSFLLQENTYGQTIVVPNQSANQSDSPFPFWSGCFPNGYHLQVIHVTKCDN